MGLKFGETEKFKSILDSPQQLFKMYKNTLKTKTKENIQKYKAEKKTDLQSRIFKTHVLT